MSRPNYCQCCGAPCAKTGSESGSIDVHDSASIQRFKKTRTAGRCEMLATLNISFYVCKNGCSTPVCDDCLAIGLDVIRARLASMPTRAPELSQPLTYFPHLQLLYKMRDLLDKAVNGRKAVGTISASEQRSALAEWTEKAARVLEDLPFHFPEEFDPDATEGNCPECRSDAYIGLNVVDCSNAKCRHYTPTEKRRKAPIDDDGPRIKFFRDLTKFETDHGKLNDAMYYLVQRMYYLVQRMYYGCVHGDMTKKEKDEWCEKAKNYMDARQKAFGTGPSETAVTA